MLPFYLSARYTDNAIRGWRSDPQRALDDLARAADLNPWSSRPLAAESEIAAQAGDPGRALSSIDDAISRSQDDWLLYVQQARVLGKAGDTQGAAAALAQARELNPTEPEIDDLAKDLGKGS
jgi:Flp pilus assembly protein TadD